MATVLDHRRIIELKIINWNVCSSHIIDWTPLQYLLTRWFSRCEQQHERQTPNYCTCCSSARDARFVAMGRLRTSYIINIVLHRWSLVGGRWRQTWNQLSAIARCVPADRSIDRSVYRIWSAAITQNGYLSIVCRAGWLWSTNAVFYSSPKRTPCVSSRAAAFW